MTPGQREGLECGDRECTHSPCWEYRRVVEKVIASERRRIRRAQAKVLAQLRTGDTDEHGMELLAQLDAATRRPRKR